MDKNVTVEVVVTTKDGVFKARTKRRAMALAAAASVIAERLHAERIQRIEWAGDRAMAWAFRILRAKLYAPPGEKISVFDYFPVTHRLFSSLCTFAGESWRDVVLHTDSGDIATRFGHRVIGVVMAGNGYPAAVATLHEGNNERFLTAVAKVGDVLGTCLVPTIVTLDDFNTLTE